MGIPFECLILCIPIETAQLPIKNKVTFVTILESIEIICGRHGTEKKKINAGRLRIGLKNKQAWVSFTAIPRGRQNSSCMD